ncbi:hypothetical protein [Roseomonas sp. HF4]|uniref:hypothetical protein n=1 Tax=Roseomonas sp. HF4 TaxID=2562313 RepID=UPI0010C14FB1|nr:hypothetical protein [Roseomonas sp. HF4]
MTLPGWDAVPPFARGALVAAAAALAWALAARLAGRPRVLAAAAGVGLLAGFVAVLGVTLASPRQLLERLPALVAIGLLAGAVASARPRPVAAFGVAAGLIGGAWWLAGAPMHPQDLLRGAAAMAAVLAGMVVAWWRGAGAWPMASAWAALALGLGLAAARGPYLALAFAGLAAIGAAALARGAAGPASRMPFALALAALAAVPVLARGAPADVAAAAAPALALFAGPVLAARLPRRIGRWAGPPLAAAPALALAWVLA